MNLKSITTPSLNDTSAIDLDVASRLGPVISQHISALESLAKLIDKSDEIQTAINALKATFENSSVALQSNVLETDKIAEGVVYRFDPEKPMDNSEILILGGAGRYTMAGLRNKAAREAAMLADDLTGNYVNYRGAAHSVKQVANTINTMVAALDELNEIKRKGGARSKNIEVTETDISTGVSKLEDKMLALYISNPTITNEQMSIEIEKFCTENSLPMIKVLKEFEIKHRTPILEWAKTADLDKKINEACIIEMYETLKIGLGDKSWVSIAKRLKAQGMPQSLAEQLIDRAIIKVSKK